MESCYRHPGVETGVSCQRCDRYICPECSTPGAVGFLCPEDAKDKVKVIRPRFQQSLFSRAPITMTLIGINSGVYILQQIGVPIIEMFAFMRIGQGIEFGSPWRAFTSAFVHSQAMFTHILFNMYSLFVLGTLLEPMLGKLKFSLLTSQIVIILVINVVVSFLPGIAWQAHFGGFIFGALVAVAYTRFSRPDQRVMLLSSIALLVLALISLWVYGNQMMPPIY